MIRIWGRRSAFNVQKVLWLIGELGLAHEHIDAGGAAGGLGTPEFLAMNPHGQIPVIDDDGTTVWESHSVLRYLAARYAPGSLWPEGGAGHTHDAPGPVGPGASSKVTRKAAAGNRLAAALPAATRHGQANQTET